MASGTIRGGNVRNKQQMRVYSHKMIGARGEESSQSRPASSYEDDVSSRHQTSSRDDGLVYSDLSSQDLARSALSKATGRGLMNGSSIKFDGSVSKFSAGLKREVRQWKRTLLGELDEVRKLLKKLEAKEGKISTYKAKSGWSNSQVSDDNSFVMEGNLKHVNSEVGSVGIPEPRPRQGLSASADSNNDLGKEFVETEERPLKSNPVNRSSNVFQSKILPLSGNKKVKKLNGKIFNNEVSEFGLDKQSSLFKSCSNLLTKLMKHNYGWVFNAPVDAKSLGLHDYFTVIDQPMDLGTVKAKLNSCSYKSPEEFAYDVRLTFQNAIKYNPVGRDVHFMAGTLLKSFGKSWGVIEREHNLVQKPEAGLPMPATQKAPSPAPKAVPSLPTHPDATSSERVDPRNPAVKESVKNMTYEDKQRLSEDLQKLPSEQLEHVVYIIRKRNAELFQHEDEVEVDIDVVDAETLWELQEFVDSYKSSLNKLKRKADTTFNGFR